LEVRRVAPEPDPGLAREERPLALQLPIAMRPTPQALKALRLALPLPIAIRPMPPAHKERQRELPSRTEIRPSTQARRAPPLAPP